MTLQQLRDRIDQIDIQLIELLVERFSIVNLVGEYKRIHDMPLLDDVRRKHILMSVTNFAKQKGLSESFVRDLRERIHQESLLLQKTKKPD